MSANDRPGSKLIAFGVLAMAIGILVPNQLANLFSKGNDAMSLPVALTIDGLRAGFFLGLAAAVIGLLRNRKAKNEKGPDA
jgi:hypothetical protein